MAPASPTGRRRGAWLALIAAVLAGAAWITLGPADGAGLGLGPSLVLGLVEGVTEFLPVSSTGHLAVVERILGVAGTPAERAAVDSYLIVVQGGAILAVGWLYRARLLAMAATVTRPGADRGVLRAILIASLPAGLLGLLLGDAVKERLLAPGPIALAWLVGGVLILAVARRRPNLLGTALEAVTWRQAAAVGLAQAVALWPGTSRSLVTIVAGTLAGLSLAAAVELSFLLGFVVLLAATGWEVLRHGHEIVAVLGWQGPVLGSAVAFASAVVAVRWLVGLLNRRGLSGFGYYRIVIGVVVGVLAAGGVL